MPQVVETQLVRDAVRGRTAGFQTLLRKFATLSAAPAAVVNIPAASEIRAPAPAAIAAIAR